MKTVGFHKGNFFWSARPYCPRCVNYIVTTGNKFCNKCAKEMRKETENDWAKYSWPNGNSLPHILARQDG